MLLKDNKRVSMEINLKKREQFVDKFGKAGKVTDTAEMLHECYLKTGADMLFYQQIKAKAK